MFQVQSLVALLGLTLCVLPSHKTMAQEFSESGVVYEAARNKIGLIRYCRDNQFLAPAIADQTVAAMGARLSKLPPGETFDRQRGDRAQQAGEDGFWDVGRRRYIANIAHSFRTTPAELCQEWADETLRGQAPRYLEVKTITVPPPIQPLPQAKPIAAEPIQADRPPAPAPAVVKAAHSAAPPPLPEKAPFLPAEARLVSFQRTLPTGGDLASTGRAVPEDVNGPKAITPGATQSSGKAGPLSERLATEAAGPLPGEQTVAAATPLPRLYDQPQPLQKKRLFNRLGTAERCLIAGCKWPTRQAKDPSRY
jgi:hypothetical protein